MKPKKLAAVAALAMSTTGAGVFFLVPPGGFHASTTPNIESVDEEVGAAVAIAAPDLGKFEAGTTLDVTGRVGQTRIAKSGNGDELVMIDVKGATDVKAAAAPAKLAIVIDRSGSMKGARMRNAIDAATLAVEKLADGDSVTVLAFDTKVVDVVPPTEVTSSSRGSIETAIRGIQLGGDTCISCGIERAMTLLDNNDGRVARMIVLSDGDANNGVRDVPGFRSMAQRSMQRGISITTIGVDVDFNEKIMTAIAEDSNGRHYFVENAEGLAKVFETEADALNQAVASDVEVAIDLAPGVELERVFDRSFRKNGKSVVVPLGAVARGEEKTVLLKVRAPRDTAGQEDLASVGVRFKDLTNGSRGACNGKLAIQVSDKPGDASEIDPAVLGRAERTETAAALRDANQLFEQGRVDEANRRLATQRATLERARDLAFKSAAATPVSKDVSQDFDNQLDAVSNGNKGFATPPAVAATPSPFAQPAPPPQASRQGKSQVKSNAAEASKLAF